MPLKTSKPYVDGYVIPVSKRKLAAYKKMAASAAKIWMKHGALGYFECAGDDMVPDVGGWKIAKFADLAKAKKGETVIFAFILYKSRAHRDKVNKKVMEDPVMSDPKNANKPMPFDMKRMAFAGFNTIVGYKK